MADTLESILFVVAVVVFVVVLPLLWLRHLRRRRQQREQEEAARFEQRLLHPNFAEFKSRYGCEPPMALRQLYQDRRKLLDEDFKITIPASGKSYSVARFEPLDAEEWPDTEEGLLVFATDDCGDQFCVDPKEPDPDVCFLDHETGRRERLGVRLSEFLATPGNA